MPEIFSKFIQDVLKKKEKEQTPHFEVGSALLANPDHPNHCEDRVSAMTLADGKMAVIAAMDGVGSGGKDSEAAAEIVHQKLNLLSKIANRNFTRNEAVQVLGRLIVDAAKEIREQQHLRKNPSMDSTISAGLVFTHEDGKRKLLLTANIGDSRIYRFNSGSRKLDQITKDDSLVQMLVDQKFISKESAFTDPRRNQITKAVSGTNQISDVAFTITELNETDVILAVSDGISDNIPPEQLLGHLKHSVLHSGEAASKSINWNNAAEKLAKTTQQIQKDKRISYAKPDDISVAFLYLPKKNK